MRPIGLVDRQLIAISGVSGSRLTTIFGLAAMRNTPLIWSVVGRLIARWPESRSLLNRSLFRSRSTRRFGTCRPWITKFALRRPCRRSPSRLPALFRSRMPVPFHDPLRSLFRVRNRSLNRPPTLHPLSNQSLLPLLTRPRRNRLARPMPIDECSPFRSTERLAD